MKFLCVLLVAIFLHGCSCYAQCDFPVPNFQVSEIEATGISKSQYENLMDHVEKIYGPVFASVGCPLELHRSWSNSTVNAQAWKSGGLCHVQVFGGFARYWQMTRNAVAIVACHEIGHHLAGSPYYRNSLMSVEGQSDYYATEECMRRLGLASSAGSLVTAKSLARLSGEARMPSRSDRSTEQVSRTMEGHPRAQCRLDTFDRGRLGLARPGCWYAGG